MEKFRIIEPTPVLAPFVRHYWLLVSDDGVQSQRIIPSGHTELIFHRGNRMLRDGSLLARTSVCGQNMSFSDLAPTGAVDMIVVVFQPFGARAFFDMPIYELSGLCVSPEEMEDNSLKELEDRILETPDDEACIVLIDQFLTRRLSPLKEYNYKRMVAAVRAINLKGGEMSVSELARIACLSTKQFHRVFNEHIGASPKDFMRIVRFHKALFTLQNNPRMSFTRLAHECGYYDQSHLANEFRQLSGYTPTEYVAICSPYSDYFSG